MMISPNLYIELLKDKTYEELIKERRKLSSELTKLEKEVFWNSKECYIHINPSPDVRYIMRLKYMEALCSYMNERFDGTLA